MNTKIQDFIKKPAGKLLIAVCLLIMIFCWGYVIVQTFSGSGKLFPSDSDIASAKDALQGARKEWLIQVSNQKVYDDLKAQYKSMCDMCWDDVFDGDVEIRLRELVEKAASESEVQLTSLGTVKKTKINDELSFAEIDVNFTDSIEKIVKMLERIAEKEPELYWQRMNLTIDFTRRNTQTGTSSQTTLDTKEDGTVVKRAPTTNLVSADTSGDTVSGSSDTMLRFNGSIRVMCYMNPNGDKETNEK